MKNHNIATIETTATIESIAATFQAAKDARKAYEDARRQMVRDIVSQLPSDPETPVLNVDLANATGLTPSHMASVMAQTDSRSGVQTTTVVKTRRFAEVDESGKVIDGGRIKTEESTLVAYYIDKTRRW